jgi:hypothetical protein
LLETPFLISLSSRVNLRIPLTKSLGFARILNKISSSQMAQSMLNLQIGLQRRTQIMLLPSLSIISLVVAVITILMATNWYVWGRTWASDFRQPSRNITPFSGKALIEQALAQLIATNHAVLPRIAITHDSRTAHPASSFAPADGGFKHVA